MRVVTGRFVHSKNLAKIEVLDDIALGYDEDTGEVGPPFEPPITQ